MGLLEIQTCNAFPRCIATAYII